jgi:hypothetical protein
MEEIADCSVTLAEKVALDDLAMSVIEEVLSIYLLAPFLPSSLPPSLPPSLPLSLSVRALANVLAVPSSSLGSRGLRQYQTKWFDTRACLV